MIKMLLSPFESPVLAHKKPKFNKYVVQNERFAKGNFGEIILARDATDKEVVLKKLPKTTEVRREIEAGKRMIGCPTVAKFIEHIEQPDSHYLVFERVVGTDLFQTMEGRRFVPFKEKDVKKIFRQIFTAIDFAHKKGVTHRDIKLENILMDNQMNVKVIDFGLCDLVQKGDMSERFCGSVDYVAPEVLAKKPYNSFQSDVFSLGVVLYTLLFAEFPFSSNERLISVQQGKAHPKLTFVENKFMNFTVSEMAKDLIQKMLHPVPSQRATLEDVKKHPWMKISLF